jgi:predicted CoA-binding protein
MNSLKKTLIIGASSNPDRYAYKAAERLSKLGYEFFLVGVKRGNVFGIEIAPYGTKIREVHTITLYINPTVQAQYYEYILSLNPTRIIFNPGTENKELEILAQEKGIEVIEACTLVMLATHQY